MKKTLLMAAAALAAGVISIQAQVYSQNIVGYYNVTIPANKFALVGNQLNNPDGSNNLANVFSSSSFASQSTTLYAWNGSALIPFTYYSDVDASPSPAGWYDGDGNPPSFAATPGNAYFIYSGISNVSMTVVGSVITGTNVIRSIPVGFTPLSATIPAVTNIDASIVGLGFAGASQNATYYHWNAASQSYDPPLTYYNAADADPFPAGYYDGGGSLQPWSSPAVGEGFFFNNSSGSSITWSNIFNP